jgi:hypothetical protein
MNYPTSTADALRDLFRAHTNPHIWLPALLVLVVAMTLGMAVREILHARSGTVYIPPELGAGVAYSAVLSWTVPTVCAYVGGFILGRVYKPRL